MSELKLIIKVDEASASRAKRAVQEVDKAQNDYIRNTKNASRDVQQLTKEQEKLNRALQNTAKAQQKAGSASKGGGGDLGAIAGGLGAVSPELGGLVGSVDSLDKLKTSIKGMGAEALKGGLALGAVAVAFVAMQAVAQDFFETANRQADELRANVDGYRKVEQAIAAGLNTEQAVQLIEQLNARREAEANILQTLTEQQQTFRDSLEQSFGVFGGLVEFFLKLIGDPRVNALDEEIAKAEKGVAQFSSEIQNLESAVSSGRLSANDAKKATEEATTAERDLSGARDNSARDAQRAQAETQRAQQQAQAEAQRNAERASETQRKYAQALADVAKQTADAVQDLIVSSKRQLAQEATALADDLSGIGRKGAISIRETQIKALEDEAKSYREHYGNLDRIRRDALASEREAEASRNFAQIAEIRRATAVRLEEEGIAFDEQQREADIANRQRKNELGRSLADERRERLIGYQQQRRDLRENVIAQLQDIRTTNDRRLRDARDSYNAELSQFTQYLQARVTTQANALGASGGASGGGGGMSNAPDANIRMGSGTFWGGANAQNVYQGYQRSLENYRNYVTNNFRISSNQPKAVGDEVLRVMQQIGLG